MSATDATRFICNHISICKRCRADGIPQRSEWQFAMMRATYCLCGQGLTAVLYGPAEKDKLYEGAYEVQYAVSNDQWRRWMHDCA